VKHGLGRFTPKSDKAASFAALKNTLKKSGYKLDSAEIIVTGTLIKDGAEWWLEIPESKQRFRLQGGDAATFSDGARLKITGDWQTVGEGATSREVIKVSAAQKIARARGEDFKKKSFANSGGVSTVAYPSLSLANLLSERTSALAEPKSAIWQLSTSQAEAYATVENRGDHSGSPVQVASAFTPDASESANEAELYFAPIRTTSPGLTVYKGGGMTTRYIYTEQHLGNLRVSRQGFRVAASYTPTPVLQLEAEVPFQHTGFHNGSQSGSGNGFGNVTLWGKYRFYRTLETWGDKQAAFRFGVELPTGQKDAPTPATLNASAFVRQQLTPINNGWAGHFDLSYSQAHKRFLYGANVEATARGERDGYRLGHEIRLNTDLEYVLLPFKYRSPTKELFVIFETTYLHRGTGRVAGVKVAGSGADEFYVAPGLQYVASQRVILEASFQVPAVLNTGALALRTDKNFLFGARLLY
jgi:hypothetical protein